MKYSILCLKLNFMDKKVALLCIMICFLGIIIITNPTLAFADIQISNEIGTLQLNQDYFEISKQANEMIKVFGNVNSYSKGDKVTVVFTTPLGDQQGQQMFLTQSGNFETFLILGKDFKEGTYSVMASYNSKIIGSLSFLVEHKKFSPTGSSVKPTQTRNILESIIVTADKNSYSNTEKIKISGEVRDTIAGIPVTLLVYSPNGNLIGIEQIDVGGDKKFYTEIITGGPLWKSKGTYTIMVQYGSEFRTAQANFEYSSSGLGGTSPQTSGSSVNPSQQSKITSYSTKLSLQVVDGSSAGWIKVKPELTYGSGIPIPTKRVDISVDGNYETKVSSNQWSTNIWAASGTRSIQANVPELNDPSDSSVRYEASSNTVTFFVTASSGGGAGFGSGVTFDVGFPIEYILIGIIIAGTISVAIVLVKKKKAAPMAMISPAKTPSPSAPQTTTQDDTQFWVCPHCGRDTEYKNGKQYCSSCNVYL